MLPRSYHFAGRDLLQACQPGCDVVNDGCVTSMFGQSPRCIKCLTPLVALTSGSCGCLAGTYLAGNSTVFECRPCGVGYWCPGTTLAVSVETYFADGLTGGRTKCGDNLVTRGQRSTSIKQCSKQHSMVRHYCNSGVSPVLQMAL